MYLKIDSERWRSKTDFAYRTSGDFVLTVLLCINILPQKNVSSRMHYMGESKNPFYLYWKCFLASFVLTFASALQKQVSWSQLVQSLTKWKWRSRIYIPDLASTSESSFQLGHWEHSRAYTSSFVKWKRLKFLRQDLQMVTQHKIKCYHPFPMTFRKLDINTFQAI